MSTDPSFNPFPGLRPFRTEEHHLFFGREEQTIELLGLLREHRFLAVVGTSGSGKSSLVRAGVIPALHRGAMTQAGSSWEVVVLRPGGNPIANLARALIEAELYDSADPDSLPRLQATLNRSLYGLVEAVRQSNGWNPAANLLVVVDQFEELFRFRQGGLESEEAAGAFVQLLLSASEAPDQRLYIAITMRSDYLGDCSQIPGLAEAVNRGEYLVPRLSRSQKREAIEMPVGVGGARIATRLVLQMLNDVGDDPDQLPVLQHALMRTFDAWARAGRKDQPIDLEHYEGIGAMAEALSRHADEVFDGLPDGSHRRVCERLFRALTEKGADNRGTRRPLRFGQAVSITGAGAPIVAAVAGAFRAPGVTFLMPGSERELNERTVIDLSHESLMRIWTRLRAWVEEEAQSARIYRRLAETAALWREGRAGLYRDPDLQIARTWCDSVEPNAAWGEQYGGGFETAMAFLNASRDAAEAEARAHEAARQREIEQANALAEIQRRRAEDERRSARRMRRLSAVAGIVALIALAACFIAVLARRESQKNADLAKASARFAADKEHAATELAGQLQKNLARSEFNTGIEKLEAGEGAEGLARLASALRTDPSYWQAGMRVMSVLAAGRFPLQPARRLEQKKVIVDFLPNPQEELLYTFDDADEEKISERFVWDARTGERLYQVAAGKKLAGVQWSADGTRLYGLLSEESAVHSWDARSGNAAAAPIAAEGIAAFDVVVRKDGSHLVLVRHRSSQLQVWLAGASATPLTGLLERASPASIGFGFVPGSERIFGICADATIGIWEVAGGALSAEISTRPHALRKATDVKFSPDGSTVLARVEGGKRINWWRLDDPGAVGKWLEFENGLDETWRFIPGGDKVVLQHAAAQGGGGYRVRVLVYDLASRERVASIEASIENTSLANSIIFTPLDSDDSLRFALLGMIEAGNLLRIWDLETGTLLREITTNDLLRTAIFSPEGRRVVTASDRGEVMIRQVFSGLPTLPAPIAHKNFWAMGFTPDGELLITLDLDRNLLQVWDSRTGLRIAEPRSCLGMRKWILSAKNPERRLLTWEKMETSRGTDFTQQTMGRFTLADIGRRPELPELLLDGSGARSRVIAYSPDGAKIALFGRLQASEPSQVLVWDSATGELQKTTQLGESAWPVGGTIPVQTTVCRLIVGAPYGRALVLDPWSGQLLNDLANGEAVGEATISSDGTRAATAAINDKVRLWDLATGRQIGDPTSHGKKVIDCLRFSPDGRFLASGSVDFGFRLADGRTGKLIGDALLTPNVVNALMFTPDSSHVAVVPFSQNVLIVETATGKVVRELSHESPCRRAAFSPDGRLLAIGTGLYLDRPIGLAHLWDWRAGRRATQPLDTRGAPSILEFSRDGALLATGTYEGGGGSVRVWDVESGQPLSEAVLGRVPVESLAFSPQGDELTAAWADGTVRRIELPPRQGTGSLERLARLAEAVARLRVAPGQGGIEEVPEDDIAGLLRERGATEQMDAYSRWEAWFLADEGQRTIASRSKALFGDYLARLRRSPNLDDLLQALRLAPNDGATHARLGLLFLEPLFALTGSLAPQKEVDAALRRHWEATAVWYSRRALELAPQDPEVWAMRSELLQQLGKVSEAGVAASRAVELSSSGDQGGSVNANYLQALSLAAEKKWLQADGAFTAALDRLSAARGPAARSHDSPPLLGILAALEPKRIAGGFLDLRLPPPIPGTFENFDAVPETQAPAGWTVSQDLPPLPQEAAESGRFDRGYSEVFDRWVAISVERARRYPEGPFGNQTLLAVGRTQRIDGVVPSPLLSGRFLGAISGWRDYSGHRQVVVTPDFDCSGRTSVHAVFHSAYSQTPYTTAAIEYSIDQGRTWLPIVVRLHQDQLVHSADGAVDAAATLTRPQPGIVLALREDGKPLGGTHGEVLAGAITSDSLPVIDGRPVPYLGQTNQVEVFRLPRADGEGRVRLRFAFAGRTGYTWGIDDFGLYEIPGEAVKRRAEVLDLTRDAGSLARLALFTLLGRNPEAAAQQDIADLAREAAVDAPPEAPAEGIGAAPSTETSVTVRQSHRRRLDAALLAQRAAALLQPGSPAAGDVLNVLCLAMGAAGETEAAEKAFRQVRQIWRGLPERSAGPFAAVLRAQGEERERAGDKGAAGVAYDLSQLFYGVANGKPDRWILDRLADLGILAKGTVFLPRGSEWRYLDSGIDPAPDWIDPAFDDRLWLLGRAPMGYGDDGEVTKLDFGADPRKKPITAWFRTAFTAESLGRFAHIRLSVRRDDGVVIYLNGQEVARENMPAGAIDSKTLALLAIADSEEKREVEINLAPDLLREGRNVLAVEVHQHAADSSDLGLDLEVAGVGGLKDEDWDPTDLEAAEERLGLEGELRNILWTARSERFRRGGQYQRAAEALERAARWGARNPAASYERAMLSQAQGEAEAAYASYVEAIEAVIALKLGPPSTYALFLPKTFSTLIEPIVQANGYTLAAAANRLPRESSRSRELEAGWLLRRSSELDPEDHLSRLERAEALVSLGRPEEALAATEKAFAAGLPTAETPARAVRERNEWLQLRERLLRKLGHDEEADRVRAEIFTIRPRDPRLSPKLIDLSAHYTCSLYDGRDWHINKELKRLPESLRARDGIDFDLRGLIQLNSGIYPENVGFRGRDFNTADSKSYPDAVRGVQVGLKTPALHFLTSCCHGFAAAGEVVARIVVRYDDGSEVEIPLLFNVDVADWYLDAEKPGHRIDPNRFGWIDPDRRRGVHLKSWKNPHPEVTIRELDLISAKAAAAPFFVAVTAE